MLNPDSHIFLYAKGWYKKSENKFSDLKKIIGHRNGVDEKHITDSDVLEVLVDILFPLIKDSQYLFKEVFKHMLDPYGNMHKLNIEEKILSSLLGILSLTRVKKDNEIVIILDKPDYKILPKHVDPR